MSFLLNRASSAYSNNLSGEALFDAEDEETGRTGYSTVNMGQEDDDDDELEAAFGDNHRHRHDAAATSSSTARHARHGTGDDSQLDGGHDEADRLLEGSSSFQQQQPVASGSGTTAGPRHHYSRTNSTATLGNLSTVSAGGYDFEADPYDRRSAAVASTSDLDPSAAGGASSSSGSNRKRRARNRNAGPSTGGGGFLALIRDNIPLPARLRQYGLLNGNNASSNDRRRADGTTDADDDDEDDDEDGRSNWIVPPQSMPGLFGGGTKNDGVFSNMTAKPGSRRVGANGEDIVGGDDETAEKEIPPAYEMAVLDSAPPYFDTTVHTSGAGGLGGVSGGLEEILIEGLPLGNIFSFFWSLLVSMSFQFVGFLLTTLLSTSHAAKNGSRAGLGVTLIQYGLYLGQEIEDSNQFTGNLSGGNPGKDDWAAFWGGQGTPNTASSSAAAASVIVSATSSAASAMATAASNTIASNSTDPWDGPILLDGNSAMAGVTSSWISMVLMIAGYFLLVSSVLGYLKAIRYAKALRDGVSTNSGSFLEGGGIPALIARLTGREFIPVQQRERTWGLPSRPAQAPASVPAAGAEGQQPPAILFRSRPFFGLNGAGTPTAGTPSTSTRTPGTAGIPSLS